MCYVHVWYVGYVQSECKLLYIGLHSRDRSSSSVRQHFYTERQSILNRSTPTSRPPTNNMRFDGIFCVLFSMQLCITINVCQTKPTLDHTEKKNETSTTTESGGDGDGTSSTTEDVMVNIDAKLLRKLNGLYSMAMVIAHLLL